MAFTISSLVWLILLIAFVVVEALTVSLVSIWFAAGAVAALIVSGFTSSWLVPVSYTHLTLPTIA